MRHAPCLALLVGSLVALVGCGESLVPADPRSGGDTTVTDASQGAYANPAPNLTHAELDAFNLGHSIFKVNWVTAPATTADIDGLGPRFNQRSCSACHSLDGRSPPLDRNGYQLGLLFRLSLPGTDATGGPLGAPAYGTQLRTNALLGVPDDAVPHETYTEQPGTYGDGTPFSLQVPTYSVDGWSYGDPGADWMLSPRTAPSVIGLGLLEAIPEADVLANVRTGDPDGVKGKPNSVFDVVTGQNVLGRFGWKANVPGVRQQTVGALSGDMGITSSLLPDQNCTSVQTECQQAKSGGTPEISDERLAALVFYMQTLAVPARRDVADPTALRGEQLFHDIGCAKCHVSTFTTGAFPEVPAVEHQTIHPYTDLLLHDMGPGLADGRPDFDATGSEWRTPPLWGIGLLETVNGHQLLLHDGRARGLAEAILWHGGEAQAARERFRTATKEDRDALLAFLRSL